MACSQLLPVLLKVGPALSAILPVPFSNGGTHYNLTLKAELPPYLFPISLGAMCNSEGVGSDYEVPGCSKAGGAEWEGIERPVSPPPTA